MTDPILATIKDDERGFRGIYSDLVKLTYNGKDFTPAQVAAALDAHSWWMIERPASDNDHARWWNPAPNMGWMIDPLKGMRFCRREDAEAYRLSMRFGDMSTVTEHCYVAALDAITPEPESFWLCCGSRRRWVHKPGCIAGLNHPERCRWVTAEEHRTPEPDPLDDPKKPMTMLVDQEWLDSKVASDPDGVAVETAPMPDPLDDEDVKAAWEVLIKGDDSFRGVALKIVQTLRERWKAALEGIYPGSQAYRYFIKEIHDDASK